MAAALWRLVLPTISRRPLPLAPRHSLPSFTGAGKAAQAADRCTIRSYGTEDVAGQERKLILKDAWFHLVGNLALCSIYGASLAFAYYWSSVQYEHDFPEDDDV